VAPLALAGASIAIAWGAHLLGLLGPGSGRLLAPVSQAVPSPVQAVLTVLALVGSLLLVWLQCLSEEVGWRGYFLSRLMERIGPWRGLLLHGLLWGLWYALPLVFATEGLTRAPLRSTTFVLTCVLLGPLLGWLRLASRSIIPAVVANGVLTLAAGLPLLMQGVEVGWRGAAYGPPGWLPMALAFAALALGRCRRAVAVPRASGGSFMDLDVLPRRRNHPTLH
jgi:membrane protease YdiL (CAAX protease family)